MTIFIRKLSIACIIIALISIVVIRYMLSIIGNFIPKDSEILIILTYTGFCPLMFIVLAVALRKISKEIEQVNINVLQQICELERQIEELKNKS